MASGGSSSSSSGIGFTGLLTILFIALKLTGVIAWSWWWVLSPLWIVALLVVGGIGAYLAWDHLSLRRLQRKAAKRGRRIP